MAQEPKIRYSDEELEEFRTLILEKLAKAEEELAFTQRQIDELNEQGFNQQGGDWYDDSSTHADLELLQRMAQRQQRYIQDLKNALLRIQNKTYGICTVTGQLIDKNRLRLVPHATKSMEGKAIANAQRSSSAEASFPSYDEESDRSASGRAIGDRVRLPNTRFAAGAGDEWEISSEAMENAEGYTTQKLDDEEE
ncbi:MAG: hypothetical protein NZM43_03065 [Saprospiraceae bacterium]|nr:hypothetical protein [Saprospiraceae bacterium]MDW8483284.1 hypothetical protein [Saprospiraceae bacterium]